MTSATFSKRHRHSFSCDITQRTHDLIRPVHTKLCPTRIACTHIAPHLCKVLAHTNHCDRVQHRFRLLFLCPIESLPFSELTKFNHHSFLNCVSGVERNLLQNTQHHLVNSSKTSYDLSVAQTREYRERAESDFKDFISKINTHRNQIKTDVELAPLEFRLFLGDLRGVSYAVVDSSNLISLSIQDSHNPKQFIDYKQIDLGSLKNKFYSDKKALEERVEILQSYISTGTNIDLTWNPRGN